MVAKQAATIAELRRLLAKKEKELRRLGAMRKKLVAQLKKVDGRVAKLEGAPVKRGPKPRAAKVRRRRPTGRRRRKTLKQAATEILAGTRKALGARDIAGALGRVGYVSKSKNLMTMIGSVLSSTPEFYRVARGKYRLQRRRGRPPKAAKAKGKAPAKA